MAIISIDECREGSTIRVVENVARTRKTLNLPAFAESVPRLFKVDKKHRVCSELLRRGSLGSALCIKGEPIPIEMTDTTYGICPGADASAPSTEKDVAGHGTKYLGSVARNASSIWVAFMSDRIPV